MLFLRKNFIYTYEDGRVVRDDYKVFKTKDYVTSVLPYNKVISLNFKIAEDEEDLILKAEDYVYNEGALDLDKEYKINYFFYKKDNINYVEAAVVDYDTLKETFNKFVNDFKYIDYISFAPAVFEEYYNLSGEESGNHMFLYFDEEDSFVSFIKDGKFVFSKALSKFSALKNEMQVDAELVIDALKTEGIVDLGTALEKNITVTYPQIASFFDNYLTKLDHIISKNLEYYQVSSVDKIFFYSPFEIKYLEEYFKQKLNIDFELYKVDTDYDPFDVTAVHYNAKHLKDENTNFSIFLRPPPFCKTKAGQFILFVAFGFLAIGADAGYKYYKINEYEKKTKIYNMIYSKKQRKIRMYKNLIKKYDKKIEKLLAENLEYKKKIDAIYKNLQILNNIDSKEPLFNKLIKLDKLYKKYDLQVIDFNKDKNSYSVIIKSSETTGNFIALFMKDLLKLDFKNVSSKEISKDKNFYIAEVKFDE